MTFNIVCAGPGPHIPVSGVLGTSDRSPTADVRCDSPSCIKPIDPAVTNQLTIQQQAQLALVANRTYLGIAAPTQAQAVTQVHALTQQVQALIRLALSQFDGTN